jgi:MinD superfamily P-loop ATPase
MQIAIASGKGGTGKTLVAANLAFVASQSYSVTLIDCDVEEPNLHLFFPVSARSSNVTVPTPVVDRKTCNFCGACAEFCQYGAIAVLRDRILFFPDLCHSCGGCLLVCPKGAIDEEPVKIGKVTVAHPSSCLTLVTGVLDEGKPQAAPVIRAAKEHCKDSDVVVLDAPPGTACALIETLDGCDACILVTESTPFGLHDLQLAAGVTALLGIPTGVVINRSDGCDDGTIEFCAAHRLPVLATIPFDREIAIAHNRGNLISRENLAWQKIFTELQKHIMNLSGVGQ